MNQRPGATKASRDSRHAGKRKVFLKWLDAVEKHGPLMTREIVATGLGVSRQRVHQMIQEGKLQVVRVGARDYVPLTAFRTLTDEPPSQPES